MRQVKIIVYRVGKEPVLESIPDDYKAMQQIVGGYLGGHHIAPNLQIMCHDEGKLIGLTPNRWVPRLQDAICGDFFVTRHDEEGETQDVTEKDLALCSQSIVSLSEVGYRKGAWRTGTKPFVKN